MIEEGGGVRQSSGLGPTTAGPIPHLRRAAVCVAGVHVAAPAQQQLDDVKVAGLGSEVQRGLQSSESGSSRAHKRGFQSARRQQQPQGGRECRLTWPSSAFALLPAPAISRSTATAAVFFFALPVAAAWRGVWPTWSCAEMSAPARSSTCDGGEGRA